MTSIPLGVRRGQILAIPSHWRRGADAPEDLHRDSLVDSWEIADLSPE